VGGWEGAVDGRSVAIHSTAVVRAASETLALSAESPNSGPAPLQPRLTLTFFSTFTDIGAAVKDHRHLRPLVCTFSIQFHLRCFGRLIA
jgi:hypothetical protein